MLPSASRTRTPGFMLTSASRTMSLTFKLSVDRSGYRAVTPVGAAAPAVCADTHSAADQRSVTCFRAAGHAGCGEQLSRELLVGIQYLHAQLKPAAFEFRGLLANQQRAYRRLVLKNP